MIMTAENEDNCHDVFTLSRLLPSNTMPKSSGRAHILALFVILHEMLAEHFSRCPLAVKKLPFYPSFADSVRHGGFLVFCVFFLVLANDFSASF